MNPDNAFLLVIGGSLLLLWLDERYRPLLRLRIWRLERRESRRG
jgi:hypothetical protein